jgi:hypothetical protein
VCGTLWKCQKSTRLFFLLMWASLSWKSICLNLLNYVLAGQCLDGDVFRGSIGT